MFHVVLYQPEIPPNTGNLMRLCVNTGCRLHLIEPLGFSLDDQRLRRAGLDYREYADVQLHNDWNAFMNARGNGRLVAFSERGDTLYTTFSFEVGDTLLFGPESGGLPSDVLRHPAISARLRIPIAPGGRSLNLANAAAVAVYEGWRQLGFLMSSTTTS